MSQLMERKYYYRLIRADSWIIDRSRPPGMYVNGFGPPGRLKLLIRTAGIFETSWEKKGKWQKQELFYSLFTIVWSYNLWLSLIGCRLFNKAVPLAIKSASNIGARGIFTERIGGGGGTLYKGCCCCSAGLHSWVELDGYEWLTLKLLFRSDNRRMFGNLYFCIVRKRALPQDWINSRASLCVMYVVLFPASSINISPGSILP